MGNDKIKESIKILIEAGCDVTANRNRLYRHSQDEYIILRFNKNANIEMSKEESFDNLDDAVGKFILLSWGKS